MHGKKKKKKNNAKFSFEIIILGGGPLPHFLLVRVKLGYSPNFNFLGKPLLVEKYVQGKKEEEETIMPSLVATTSTPARKPFVRTHYVRTNIAFARGGAHLPIAHALRLLSTKELRFGLTKLNFFLKFL